MAAKTFPVLVATRVTRAQRDAINSVARAEGLTVSELLRRIVMSGIRARLLRLMDGPGVMLGQKRIDA